jgi:hypothetical protein
MKPTQQLLDLCEPSNQASSLIGKSFNETFLSMNASGRKPNALA